METGFVKIFFQIDEELKMKKSIKTGERKDGKVDRRHMGEF